MQRHSLFLMAAAALFFSLPAHATSLRELQPLFFGSTAVLGAPPQSVTVAPNGSETHTAGIMPLRMPGVRAGAFQITDLPVPATPFYVTIEDTELSGPVGQIFDITDFQTDPACTMDEPCSGDGDGNLTLRIGATLTSRTGTSYGPGAYRGTYTLMLNF
jgi:hypothetical protein